jgi:spermidine synthase
LTGHDASLSLSPSAPLTSRLHARWGSRAVVFLGGVNLILIQWVLVRELTALLLGTELVVLLVTVAYFVGLSVGYGLAGRIRRGSLLPLGVITLILHLTLPVWFRLLVAALETAGAYGAAFLILPVLTPFVVSAFYSIFLPLFADGGEGSLPLLYAVELSGSALGVALLVALGPLGLQILFAAYAAALLLILLALGLRPVFVAALSLLAVGWLAALPGLSDWSNARWFEAVQGLASGSRTLYSAYSAYQKVDVLEEPDGTRYLYLDGLEHFGSPDGERLNVMMGHIPARLMRPRNALVVGAGSMQMARMIADYSGHVATVELDPAVVQASTRYFNAVNMMDVLPNRSIVIDDAKHFIANTDERYDLVATDVPAAFAIQTATLYSAPFYAQIHDHLNPGGILVVGLTSTFAPDDIVSRRVAASLLANFDEVMVITPESVGWSFAYAGDDLPFDRQTIEAAVRSTGESQYAIFATEAVRTIVGDAPPITLDSMDIVLETSADWIGDRLRP